MKARNLLMIIVAAIFLLWCMLIAADCLLLRYGILGKKPILTVGSTATESSQTFYGFGYCVRYYGKIGNVNTVDGITYIEQLGRGAEFLIFNKISVWRWEE